MLEWRSPTAIMFTLQVTSKSSREKDSSRYLPQPLVSYFKAHKVTVLKLEVVRMEGVGENQ